MTVDLSRSIAQTRCHAIQRAVAFFESGRVSEAAAIYREAARLERRYAAYAVSPAERSRRLDRAVALEKLADNPPRQRNRAASSRESHRLEAEIETFIVRADTSWDDIGGLETTKREIQLAYALAMAKRPAGVVLDVVSNLLLYGPPGTGKSLLAAAVSSGLEAIFFNVGASTLLSKWFGESSRLIAALYELARRRAPSVVFIDELEAIFPRRDSTTTGAERRVLSTLLAELSGVGASGSSLPVFTIGATNAPWLMDAAALSRFGRRIHVPLPDAGARREVLQIHLLRKGHSLEFPIERLAKATEGFSARQLAHVASAAVERMVADANPDLGSAVAGGRAALAEYRIRTRRLRWSDVAPILANTKPDTSPGALRRFESW